MNEVTLSRAVERAREKSIIIPTFAQLRDPDLIPNGIAEKLPGIALSDVHPLNLFRISWKNDLDTGLFGTVNSIEFPRSLTGVQNRIIGLVGRCFPTGSHKVGAAFGCLVPRLVSGQFDPAIHKAVWPSTGNYCRGGAFDCALLGCTAVAILPEEMSPERFEWLQSIGAQTIRTPGSESNVKEIFDKCWQIRRQQPDYIVFNQFDEFGNSIWHYHVTGSAVEEVFQRERTATSRCAAFLCATGSAGTIAAGDYLKKIHPEVLVAGAESLECPTLLLNGFGSHRIEGIGDKHVPWIHNVRNMDMVVGIHDQQCMNLLRLFNEQSGCDILRSRGSDAELISALALLGISGIANLIGSIKLSRYYEMDENDIVFTVLTDSSDLYQSRIREQQLQSGDATERWAEIHFERDLGGIRTDFMKELGYYDRKALHNLKYFTWVEQQGKSVQALDELWKREFWEDMYLQIGEWDRRIEAFNQETGLLDNQ